MASLPTSAASPADVVSARTRLLARLTAFRARVRQRVALAGLARLAVLLLALIVVSLLGDRMFHLSRPMRLVALALALGGIICAVRRWLIQPLGQPVDLIGLAAALENRSVAGPVGADGRPVLGARVATVLQLAQPTDGRDGSSPAFAEAAVRNSAAVLEGVDFDRFLDRRSFRTHAGAIALAILLPLLWAGLDSASAGLWARRWFLASNEPWPRANYLRVVGLDGDRIIVPRGEPYTLRVSPQPGTPPPAGAQLRYRAGSAPWANAALTRFGPDDFRYEFPPVQDATRVYVTGGDDSLDPFTLDPVDRPRIIALELKAQHPTEKAPEVHTFTGSDTDVAFLPKTHLALTVTSNVDVGKAHLRSAALSGVPGAQLRRLDARRYILEWTHEKAVDMEIELTSQDAGLASTPTPISVGLKVDQPPRVTLQFTGVRSEITPTAHIPMTIQARDDYALAAVNLVMEATPPDPGKDKPIAPQDEPLFGPQKPAVQPEVQIQHTLALATLGLKPGTVIDVTATAQDDCYTGAQTSRSRTLAFHVVTPEDLFRDIRIRLQAERAKLRRATDESQSIQDMLQALAAKPVAAECAKLSRREIGVDRQAAATATVISDTLIEMQLNDLGVPRSNEMLEKAVVAPLHQLHDDVMMRQRLALEALAQAADRPDPAGLTEAATRQRQITLAMRDALKQMAQWDSFGDVINELDEIIKFQGDARKSIEKAQDDEASGLFRK